MILKTKTTIEKDVEFQTPSFWKNENENRFYALISDDKIVSVFTMDGVATITTNKTIHSFELEYMQVQIAEKEFMDAYLLAIEKIKL